MKKEVEKVKDISQVRLAEAVALAGAEIQRIPCGGNPLEVFKKREEILERVIINFFRISPSEPLFGALKEQLDRAIKLCPY